MNPCPMDHEIYNFGIPFFGHFYYILGLSDLCLGVETNKAVSLYDLYGHALAQEPLPS